VTGVARAIVPPWLDRLAAIGWRVLASLAFGLVVVGIAMVFSTVVASVVVACVAVAALLPLKQALVVRGRSSTAAAGIASLVGAAVVVGVAIAVLVALVPSLVEIGRALAAGVDAIRESLLSGGAPDLAVAAFDWIVAGIRQAIAVDLLAVAASVGTLVTVLILGGFLMFFLLQDGPRGWSWLMQPLEGARAAAITTAAATGLERVGAYLRRTALLATADAIAVGIALTAIGVPVAGPLAVLTFVAGFVPYLGAVVAAVVVGMVTWATAGPGGAIVIVVVVAVTALVGDRLLDRSPFATGADLHPVVVIVAIPAGWAILGLLGVVALLPVAVFGLAVAPTLVRVLALDPDGEPAASSRPDVPAWLDRLGQWSWRCLVVVAVGAVVAQVAVQVPGLIVPVVFALVLGAVLAPIQRRLRARGLSPTAAAIASIGGSAVVIAAAIGLTVAWMLQPLDDVLDTALDGAQQVDPEALARLVTEIAGLLVGASGELLRAAAALVIVPTVSVVLAFFALRDGERWWVAITGRLPAATRDRVAPTGPEAVEVLGGYMIGTAAISLFGAVTTTLIMIILGLPLAVPIGILSFFGGFIPYVGSFVTTALAFLVAVAAGTTTDIAIMAVYTLVLNIIQGNFVTPLVYARTLSLHPAIVLLAIPAGGAVAGILGMFLAVPIIAVVSAVWRPIFAAITTPTTPGADGGGAQADAMATVTPAPASVPNGTPG
jgi:predicted PurR-regulated permease PerM